MRSCRKNKNRIACPNASLSSQSSLLRRGIALAHDPVLGGGGDLVVVDLCGDGLEPEALPGQDVVDGICPRVLDLALQVAGLEGQGLEVAGVGAGVGGLEVGADAAHLVAVDAAVAAGVVLELADAAAEEVVDDLELADAGAQEAVLGDESVVGLGRVRVGAVGGGGGVGGLTGWEGVGA